MFYLCVCLTASKREKGIKEERKNVGREKVKRKEGRERKKGKKERGVMCVCVLWSVSWAFFSCNWCYIDYSRKLLILLWRWILSWPRFRAIWWILSHARRTTLINLKMMKPCVRSFGWRLLSMLWWTKKRLKSTLICSLQQTYFVTLVLWPSWTIVTPFWKLKTFCPFSLTLYWSTTSRLAVVDLKPLSHVVGGNLQLSWRLQPSHWGIKRFPFWALITPADSLTEEMDEATKSANLIRQDIKQLRNKYYLTGKRTPPNFYPRYGFVRVNQACELCQMPILVRNFYLFPCQHVYHADCLINEVKLHLSSFAQHTVDDATLE